MSGWQDARGLRGALAGDGWMTPNTYDQCFADPIPGSAVYLFILYGWDEADNLIDFETSMVAYVGMSKRLKQRWQTHLVLRELERTGRYIQRWFRPTTAADLRDQELLLIRKFNPPWNIQGRKRGIAI
jgi:hypothetical protein